jgi:hypothetical protein
VVVVTCQIGTDSCISLLKKGYITSFVPESTCLYVAASHQPKKKSYICNLFPAGWGSTLLCACTCTFQFHHFREFFGVLNFLNIGINPCTNDFSTLGISVTHHKTSPPLPTTTMIHSLHVGWRDLFSSCAVVSVFCSGGK